MRKRATPAYPSNTKTVPSIPVLSPTQCICLLSHKYLCTFVRGQEFITGNWSKLANTIWCTASTKCWHCKNINPLHVRPFLFLHTCIDSLCSHSSREWNCHSFKKSDIGWSVASNLEQMATSSGQNMLKTIGLLLLVSAHRKIFLIHVVYPYPN